MAEAVLALRNIYSRNRSTFLRIIKISVAAGLLTFIISSVNPAEIISGILQADATLILLSFGLSFINMSLQYLKWKLICNSLLNENDRGKIVNSLFYGFSAGSFTPARVGEYLGRALAFSDKSLFQVSSAVLADKLSTLFVVVIFGSVSFMLYLNFSFIFSVCMAVLIIALIYTGFRVIILFLPAIGYKWIKKADTRLTFLKTIDTRFSFKLSVLSLIFYSCFILQFTLLISAFSHHYDFINYIWAGSLVMLTKTIVPQISFGELGIREGASVYFLKQFGENAAAGFNASIFLFLINILFPAIVGLIFLFKRK